MAVLLSECSLLLSACMVYYLRYVATNALQFMYVTFPFCGGCVFAGAFKLLQQLVCVPFVGIVRQILAVLVSLQASFELLRAVLSFVSGAGVFAVLRGCKLADVCSGAVLCFHC